MPKRIRSSPRTASSTVTSVFTGFVLMTATPRITPRAVTAAASRVLRIRSSGSPGKTAPSRTAAIGGTVVARSPG